MAIVQNLEDIWDNGSMAPSTLSGEAIDKFKSETNAKRVVRRRWICDGRVHETRYFVRLLPDRSGLVHYDNNDPASKRLIVLNADGSRRVEIDVPRIDEFSHPDNGYLSLPPSSSHIDGIEWGCEGSDGNSEYLFDFDWRTGKLLRYAKPSRSW